MMRILPATVLVSSVSSALAGATKPLSSAAAADAFNKVFEGHGPGKGVYMRATENLDLFCGGECHGTGFPDCTMSALFLNHVALVDATGQLHSKIKLVKYQAGIVFNAEVVEKTLARCYYATNAKTRYRYNGGCGCECPDDARDCKSPHSPFHNIGQDGQDVDGDHPDATKCMCGKADLDKVTANDPCFWRGPAYSTSKSSSWFKSNKEGRFGSNEVESFIRQRKAFQTQAPRMVSIWDEVVIDVNSLKTVLEHDPVSAIEGIYYHGPEDLPIATKLQSSFHSLYGEELPIVRVNDEVKVSSSKGPFVAHSLDMVGSNVSSDFVEVSV